MKPLKIIGSLSASLVLMTTTSLAQTEVVDAAPNGNTTTLNQAYYASGNMEVRMVSASSNASQSINFGDISMSVYNNATSTNYSASNTSVNGGIGANIGGAVIQAVNSSTAIAIVGNGAM